MTRNGVELHQDLRKPTTEMLICGVSLYHTIDHQLYEIIETRDTEPRFIIQRVNDKTNHDATLKQLKRCCYVLHQRILGG